MRWGRALLAMAVIVLVGGCGVSRRIVEVERPQQPPLQELEQHLDYTDPDAGRPDYIIPER